MRAWVAVRAEPFLYTHMLLIGPLNGEWWRLLTTQFVYLSGGGAGVYAFLAIGAAGLFGWLLERRHGPVVVLALYLGAGATGALVATRHLQRCRSSRAATPPRLPC